MDRPPDESLLLIKKILSDKYCTIGVKTIAILDDLDAGTCHISLHLRSGESVEDKGVGMVDAIFAGLKKHHASEYPSLNSIELQDFMATSKAKGTQAPVEVELYIKNSYGNLFMFRDNSYSLISSAARVSVAAVEFFINSEKAFLLVHKALKNARDRDRTDLVARYEAELAFLVRNTSYTEMVEAVRNELTNEVGRSKV